MERPLGRIRREKEDGTVEIVFGYLDEEGNLHEVIED